jgi:hypothetical protein
MSSEHEMTGTRHVIDLEAHPELEPDLGPTREEIAQGAEPDDALNPHADREIIEPPAWQDELDMAYGAAEARAALAGALARREDAELAAGQADMEAGQ